MEAMPHLGNRHIILANHFLNDTQQLKYFQVFEDNNSLSRRWIKSTSLDQTLADEMF